LRRWQHAALLAVCGLWLLRGKNPVAFAGLNVSISQASISRFRPHAVVVGSQSKFRLMPILLALSLYAVAFDVNLIRPPGDLVMRRLNCDRPWGLRMSWMGVH
jgi:hypothetical protein